MGGGSITDVTVLGLHPHLAVVPLILVQFLYSITCHRTVGLSGYTLIFIDLRSDL